MEKEREMILKKPDLKMKKVVTIVVLIVLMIVSHLVIGTKVFATDSPRIANIEQQLEQEKTQVLELAAACTATSAALTVLPGDIATPIADKLVDFSSYFLIVLSAIYLEKYLVVILGMVAFKYLIPIGCLLLILMQFWSDERWKLIGKKIIVFGVCISLVIPAGVWASNMIQATYQDSIQTTLETAEAIEEESSIVTDFMQEIAEEEARIQEGVTSAQEQKEAEEVANMNLLEKAKKKLQDFYENAKEKGEEFAEDAKGFISDGAETASEFLNGVSEDTVENAKLLLNQMMENLAVILVTSCLIPLLVIVFFVWIFKMLLGIDMPMVYRISKNRKMEE